MENIGQALLELVSQSEQIQELPAKVVLLTERLVVR